MAVKDFLRDASLFKPLSEDNLDQLQKLGKTILTEAGEVVCREGEDSDRMFVILEGRVKVYKRDEHGHEATLRELREGDFFGELGLLDSHVRSASISCVTPCKFFVLERGPFLDIISKSGADIIGRVFAETARKIRDLTERYAQEEWKQKLFQAEIQLDRHRSITEMVAGISHELNTPLGIVNTAIGIITEKLAASEVENLFSKNSRLQEAYEDLIEASTLAQNNIRRAYKLVDNFKNVSVNHLVDNKEAMDIHKLVLEIIDLFRINAKKSKITISVKDELGEGGRRQWLGYPGYLSQVILNFLTNIERYAYPDGVGGKVEITVGAGELNGAPSFEIAVRDFGKGIAPQNLGKIWDPFFTTGRTIGGTGLGLSVVYNIVTTGFGGTIEVESELGKGTAFHLAFPQEIQV